MQKKWLILPMLFMGGIFTPIAAPEPKTPKATLTIEQKQQNMKYLKDIFGNKAILDFIDIDFDGFWKAFEDVANEIKQADGTKLVAISENPINKFIEENAKEYANKIQSLTTLKFKEYDSSGYISKMLKNIITDKEIFAKVEGAIRDKNLQKELHKAVLDAIGADFNDIKALKQINHLFGYAYTEEDAKQATSLKSTEDSKYKSGVLPYFKKDGELKKNFHLDTLGSLDLSRGNPLVKLAALDAFYPKGFFTEEMIKEALKGTKFAGNDITIESTGDNSVGKLIDALSSHESHKVMSKNALNMHFTKDTHGTLVTCVLLYFYDKDVLPAVKYNPGSSFSLGSDVVFINDDKKITISAAKFAEHLNELYKKVATGGKAVSKDKISNLTRNGKDKVSAEGISKLITDQILNRPVKLTRKSYDGVDLEEVPNYYLETLLLSAFFDLLGAQPGDTYDKFKEFKDINDLSALKQKAIDFGFEAGWVNEETNIDVLLGALSSIRDGIHETRGSNGEQINKGKPGNTKTRKKAGEIKDGAIIKEIVDLYSSYKVLTKSKDQSLIKSKINSMSIKNGIKDDYFTEFENQFITQLIKSTFDFKALLLALRTGNSGGEIKQQWINYAGGKSSLSEQTKEIKSQQQGKKPTAAKKAAKSKLT